MKMPLLYSFLLLLVVTLLNAQTVPTLWGMTCYGGAYNGGVIFRYNISSGALTVQHNFKQDSIDGFNPWGSLIRGNNGLLYGTTFNGGVGYSYGTIFSYDISTGQEAILHSFDNAHGENPRGSLIQANNGLLYGMTGSGGANNRGIIFSYDITVDSFAVIHNFAGSDSDGDYPYGSLIQASDGLLYGITSGGGINLNGTIFSYDISNGMYTDLHDFGSDTDGFMPFGSLIEVGDSLLYGMTLNQSVIFTYNIYTSRYAIVYRFGSHSYDGEYAQASLLHANDGVVYGMTPKGGTNDVDCPYPMSAGTIFAFNSATSNDTVLHNFGKSPDGQVPEGSLIQAHNDLLYGMTSNGGIRNCDGGTIFSFDISTGQETVLYDFDAGYEPLGDLLEIEDTSTGIIRITDKNIQLTIYPNPASTYVDIVTYQCELCCLEMMDLTGREVLLKQLPHNKCILPIDNLPSGVYLAKITNAEGQSVITKVVKQ